MKNLFLVILFLMISTMIFSQNVESSTRIFIENANFTRINRDYKNVIKNHYYFGLIDVSRGQRSVFIELYEKVLKHNQRVLQLIKDELDESE